MRCITGHQGLPENPEQEGRALVIAPSEPLLIGRFEKDRAVLDRVRDLGYRDTQAAWDAIAAMAASRSK